LEACRDINVLLVALTAFSAASRTREARAADSSARDLVVRSLTIVDEHGNRRILLTTKKDSAVLALFAEKGTMLADLAAAKDVAMLELSDEKGTPRATLGTEDGRPHLQLDDERGSLRADLAATKEGPVLLLYDRDEKGIWRAP